MGYSPWGHKESGTTERLTLTYKYAIAIVLICLSLITIEFEDMYHVTCRRT